MWVGASTHFSTGYTNVAVHTLFPRYLHMEVEATMLNIKRESARRSCYSYYYYYPYATFHFFFILHLPFVSYPSLLPYQVSVGILSDNAPLDHSWFIHMRRIERNKKQDSQGVICMKFWWQHFMEKWGA